MKSLIPKPCLALVADVTVAGGVERLVDAVELAVDGGVQMVQIRANHLPTRKLTDLATKLKTSLDNLSLKNKEKALLFINRRIDIAIECGADGVQLSENTLITDKVRRILENHRLLLGRSVHSTDSALQAKVDGADLLVVGPIFETRSHPGATPKGVELIRTIAKHIPGIPILGIGGVDASNIWTILESGGHGAGLIRGILEQKNPREAARQLRDSLDTYWASSVQPVSGRVVPITMITIEVNGKPFKCKRGCTVEEYVVSLRLEITHVAVAHNGVVVARAQFGQIRLSEGDRLEIVRPVGGG